MNSPTSRNARYTEANRTYATSSSSRSRRITASPIATVRISRSPSSWTCALHAGDERLDLLRRDRPLLAGARDALDDLLAVERLAAAVLLHDVRQDLLDALVGREPPGAPEALAPAAGRLPVLRLARVDDPILEVSAPRAAHGVVSGRRAARRDGAPSLGLRSVLVHGELRAELAHLAAHRGEHLVVRRARRARAPMSAATVAISRVPIPRVVSAGVPTRTPEVVIGFSGSHGIMFLFTVIPALPSASSAILPVSFFGRRSTSMRWLSVPPETSRRPAVLSPSASACAFSTMRRWYSLNSGWSASPNATAFAAMTCSSGPPWMPGKICELSVFACASRREDHAAARAAQRLVRGAW